MNLKKLKQSARDCGGLKGLTKGAIITAFSLVPIVNMGIIYYKAKKLNMANGQVLGDVQLFENGDKIPTTLKDYEKWALDTDAGSLQRFNSALNDAKKSGQVSQEFLDKYGFASTQDVKDALNDLYALGKTGDTNAQDQFMGLYNAYQDDFYFQAHNALLGYPQLNLPRNPQIVVDIPIPDASTITTAIDDENLLYLLSAIGCISIFSVAVVLFFKKPFISPKSKQVAKDEKLNDKQK